MIFLYKILVFLIYYLRMSKGKNYEMSGMEKIVGGKESDITMSPYVVTIHKYKRNTFSHACCGSIISQRLVLTAAHCVVNYDTEKVMPTNLYHIYAGTSDSVNVQHAQRSDIEKIIPHPELIRQRNINDLAILVLYNEFVYNIKVQPLRLAEPKMFHGREPAHFFSQNDCIISGWGYTFEGSKHTTQELRSVVIPLLDNEHCDPLSPRDIEDSEMCTLDRNSQKDACQGDSGSSLVCKNLGVGVVSWGVGCARPNSPGVFTRIDSHIKWIQSTINKYNYPARERESQTNRLYINFYLLLLSFIYL